MEEPTERQEAASTGRPRRRRRCNNCNARLRGRFCTRCGQRDPHYDRVVCDNCGAEKLGHYCAVCGQSDRNYRRNVFPVVGEVLSETFELDSRLLKTLPKLLLRPGFLSAEFSRNRRASYLSPFRLYLFTSIVFFFVLSLSIDLPEGPGPGREAVLTGERPAPIAVGENEGESPWLRISINGDGADDEEVIEEHDRNGGEVAAPPERTATTAPPVFPQNSRMQPRQPYGREMRPGREQERLPAGFFGALPGSSGKRSSALRPFSMKSGAASWWRFFAIRSWQKW